MHLNTPLGLLTVTFKQSERLLQKLNIYMEFPVIISLLARFAQCLASGCVSLQALFWTRGSLWVPSDVGYSMVLLRCTFPRALTVKGWVRMGRDGSRQCDSWAPAPAGPSAICAWPGLTGTVPAAHPEFLLEMSDRSWIILLDIQYLFICLISSFFSWTFGNAHLVLRCTALWCDTALLPSAVKTMLTKGFWRRH